MSRPVKIVGLFAGIGGIETGFREALGGLVQTELLCEWWEPAKEVLAARFPEVPLHPDVRELRSLPGGVDVLAAGFPCTDLSQAGRTAGITGSQSSLVSRVFEALARTRKQRRRMPWLLIENVPNMLALDRGEAMHYLVGELEELGYRWAYRVVDSRFTGVPQRRRRVLLVASRTEDPREVLFVDDAPDRPTADFAEDAFGFYWTEGRRGLGWAQDATPTLKGGSSLGIPSPPAVWVPGAAPGQRLVVPGIEDAEALQGFPRGWTAPAEVTPGRNGRRWKLVGNAVTVGVAAWVAGRLAAPGRFDLPSTAWAQVGAWPTAAWGEGGRVWTVPASEYPQHLAYRHLLDVVDHTAAAPLSHRGAAGFLSRLEEGNLGRHPDFRHDVRMYVDLTAPGAAPLAV